MNTPCQIRELSAVVHQVQLIRDQPIPMAAAIIRGRIIHLRDQPTLSRNPNNRKHIPARPGPVVIIQRHHAPHQAILPDHQEVFHPGHRAVVQVEADHQAVRRVEEADHQAVHQAEAEEADRLTHSDFTNL
jgi:hypothetical protein